MIGTMLFTSWRRSAFSSSRSRRSRGAWPRSDETNASARRASLQSANAVNGSIEPVPPCHVDRVVAFAFGVFTRAFRTRERWRAPPRTLAEARHARRARLSPTPTDPVVPSASSDSPEGPDRRVCSPARRAASRSRVSAGSLTGRPRGASTPPRAASRRAPPPEASRPAARRSRTTASPPSRETSCATRVAGSAPPRRTAPAPPSARLVSSSCRRTARSTRGRWTPSAPRTTRARTPPARTPSRPRAPLPAPTPSLRPAPLLPLPPNPPRRRATTRPSPPGGRSACTTSR